MEFEIDLDVIRNILENKEEGFITMEEVKGVRDYFNIRHLRMNELRELRNCTVKYFSDLFDNNFSNVPEGRKMLDYMSAICGVIDNEIWERGGEV